MTNPYNMDMAKPLSNTLLGGKVPISNYGPIPVRKNTYQIVATKPPKGVAKAVPKNPGNVKLSLGNLPATFGIYNK